MFASPLPRHSVRIVLGSAPKLPAGATTGRQSCLDGEDSLGMSGGLPREALLSHSPVEMPNVGPRLHSTRGRGDGEGEPMPARKKFACPVIGNLQ
jgi:hypothetical protein